MLRQEETLQSVAEFGPLEMHQRKRGDGQEMVREYHCKEEPYFVRMVYEADREWLVKWYDGGARPLGEVGRYDDFDEANDAAKKTVRGILQGLDDPRLC